MKKRVVVLGKGKLAIQIANWFREHKEYTLTAIVPVIPEPSWTDSFIKWAKKHNVSTISSGHYKDIPNIVDEKMTIDIAFSVFYDKIIKEWFIKKCKRILNIHNGPLPRYGGVYPINWALKNNEGQHGITIHEIKTGIDNGPIVSQLLYSIYPEFDEVIDVYKRAIQYGWILFKQTMPILDKIVPRTQDDSKATYYSSADGVFLRERKSFTKRESLKEL